MVPDAVIVRGDYRTIVVVYGGGTTTTVTNLPTSPATAGPDMNYPVAEFFTPLAPARRARRPQQPALVDPWVPHRLAAAPPPPAWPAQLRRFRGDT